MGVRSSQLLLGASLWDDISSEKKRCDLFKKWGVLQGVHTQEWAANERALFWLRWAKGCLLPA